MGIDDRCMSEGSLHCKLVGGGSGAQDTARYESQYLAMTALSLWYDSTSLRMMYGW